MTRLENWSLVAIGDPYTPPEHLENALVGKVYGHTNQDKHPDGKEIRTSKIVGLKNNVILTVSGSMYKLGEVDPEYERVFPNAKQRNF